MNRRSNHALVDIDGVLACTKVLLEALNEETGCSISQSEWTTYNLTALYDIPVTTMLEAFARHDVIRRADPLPGACEALAALRREYQVHIVTHRGWHPEGFEHTRDWLAWHGMAFDTLTMVEFGQNKSDAYGRIAPRFEVFFEDCVANLDDARASGLVKQGIVIDQPWNRIEGPHFVMGRDRFGSLGDATEALIEHAYPARSM